MDAQISLYIHTMLDLSIYCRSYVERKKSLTSSDKNLLKNARHNNPSLVLVQPRKPSPYITERLLMGRKESNKTNKIVTSTDKCQTFKNSGTTECQFYSLFKIRE